MDLAIWPPVGLLPPADRALSVAIGLVNDGVGVVIANGGTPIAQDRLSHFFDKFYSTKKASGGIGLGTSYAASVIKAHGGKVSVQSSEEDGTRVKVWLPA